MAKSKQKKSKEKKSDENKKSDEDKKTAFEEFAELYGDLYQYHSLKQDVASGKSPEILPQALEQIVNENTALTDEQKLKAFNGLYENLDNPRVLYPALNGAIERRQDRYAQFGKDKLEEVLKSTPEELLHSVIESSAPQEIINKDYEDLAEKHLELVEMIGVNEQYKELDKLSAAKRTELLSYIKKEILESYKKQLEAPKDADKRKKKDAENALAIFAAIITNPKDDKALFAKREYEELTEKRREEFYQELDGNQAAYLRSYMDDEEILGLYQRIFDQQLKAQRSQK
ncbi:MAG: hypothetical protein Q8N99_01255 [Nanoarchaeota archaeon]|nr:hypothetical protein [Nanoarchaeota archaeon]